MAHRRTFALILASVLTFAAASSIGASAFASTATKASSAKSVKVMVVSTETATALGSTFPEVSRSVKARIARANATHEFPAGQKVTVEFCDEKSSATGAADCARQAVADGVVAVVGCNSSYSASLTPVLEAAGIAIIGCLPLSTPDYTSKVSFPVASGGPGVIGASLIQFGKQGLKKVDIAYLDVPVGAQAAALANAMKTGSGVDTIASTPVPASSPDYTSTVEAAAAAADGIVLLTLPPSAAGFVRAARQQNMTKPMMWNANSYTLDTLKALGTAANGVAIVGPFAPITTKNKSNTQYKADLKKYAKGTAPDDYFGHNAWLGADLFVKMTKQQKLTDLTAASVLQGMGQVTNLDMGGAIPPYTSTKELGTPLFPRIFNPFMYVGVMKNGKFVSQGAPVNAFAGLTAAH